MTCGYRFKGTEGFFPAGIGLGSLADLPDRVGSVAAIHPFQVRRLRDQHGTFDRRLPPPIDTSPQAFFKGLLEADFGLGGEPLM